MREHTVATDLGALPRRILVINPFDASRDQALAAGFASTAATTLASCKVESRIIQRGNGTRDRLAGLVVETKPDAILSGRKTVRSTNITQHGQFAFTLVSTVQKRDLWKGNVISFGAVSDEQLEEVGGSSRPACSAAWPPMASSRTVLAQCSGTQEALGISRQGGPWVRV